MGTQILNTELAIVETFKAALTNLGISAIEYPNHALSDKPNLWAAIHNLKVNTTPVTIGVNGEDETIGIIQIDINVLEGTGTGIVLGHIDSLASSYYAGTDLFKNGHNIRITKVYQNPERTIGGFYRASLSLEYYSRTVRG